jgi:hypothetical protein
MSAAADARRAFGHQQSLATIMPKFEILVSVGDLGV